MQRTKYTILFLVIISLHTTCFAQNNGKTTLQEDAKDSWGRLCNGFERHSQIADYDQRLHVYLTELEEFLTEDTFQSMTSENVQHIVHDGTQFFKHLETTLPFRIGMPKQRVRKRIEQNRFIISEPYTATPDFPISLLINSQYQGLFSSAWVVLSFENESVKRICIAPGNLSVLVPGFLFDDVTFRKDQEEKEEEKNDVKH
jgi:hypothetical protein